MHVETRNETHGAGDVERWRREQLRNAGFGKSRAGQLAHDRRWDLHALIELVERGCPPQLAVRILAPLDDAGHAA
jgi:hypothetical protein